MLMSLPESFKTFCLNYIMSKRSYALAKLLNELKVADVKVVEKAKKGKNKKKDPKQGAYSKKQKPKVSEGKPKGNCFTCG